jgi:hypothetical protein
MMVQTLLKAGAVFAACSFAFAGAALAMPQLPSNDNSLIFVQAGDMENEEVEHDLRPDIAPAPSAEEEGEGGMMKPKEEGASGDVENEEVLRDLRTEEAPPAGE